MSTAKPEAGCDKHHSRKKSVRLRLSGCAPKVRGPARYGPQTVAAVAEFQRRSGVIGDGRNVGARTLAAARSLGYQG